MPVKQESATTPTVIQTALERFKLAAEADESWRQECLDDLDFSIGNQWPETIQTIREKDGRPCLVMDQIQQSIRLVCNQYRQQPPSITINPVGNGADVDTAEIYQGCVRHIEVNSDAQVVYERTHEGMVRTGFHSCRVVTDYTDVDGDEQEIFIEWIKNAFSVYWQPGVPQEKAKWCFIIADLPHETFKTDYPDAELATSSDWTATGNNVATWFNKDYIRVAEYFEVVEEDRGAGKRPKKTIVWRKITAFQELDKREFDEKIQTIPVFTAYADDIDVDGKRYVAGLVRNAKGPQRQYNYMVSGATEAVSLAPKAPWIVAEGQIGGTQQTMWEQANVRNFAVLTYKQTDVGGKPAPPPQRNVTEPPIQGMAHMISQASMDLKASLGIYDPSLGQRRGDESGKAIERLQAQGNVATLNYSDNMGRMLKRLGKSLLEWIQVVYDTPRVQRIINPDGSVKHVVIHQDQKQQAEALAEESDIKNIYNIGVGKYDVIISVGPTYQSKRQESVQTGIDLLKTIPPQQSAIVTDLVVREMDTPWAKQVADRIKKTLPPQIVGDDDNDPEAKLQAMQAQMQALSQQHDLLAKALEEARHVVETKQIEQQGKVQIAQMQEMTKQEVTKMQEATKLAVAQINATKDANQSFAENEIEKYKILNDQATSQHDAAHDAAMQAQDQAHQQEMAQQAAAQQQLSQATDQAHEQNMNESDQNFQAQQAQQEPAQQ